MATTGTPTTGDDTLSSDGADDEISGLPGSDSIFGGGGSDTLYGDTKYLVNGDLDSSQANNSWSAGSVDGWFNTGSGGTIERWGTSFLGFDAGDGGQVIELDGNTTGLDHIQTNIDLETGVAYEITFDHGARSGPGVNDDFEVTLNGTVVATISPTTVGYFTTTTITVTGAAGVDTIGFREIASQNNSQGVILDNVRISLAQTEIDASSFTFDDTIDGGDGDDFIYGQEGNDVITGGAGNDYAEGGIGDDIFILEDGGGDDVIGDFTIGKDLLDVSGLTDAAGDPVDALDVVVTSDGEGGSILTFPNGETVRLFGVPPEDVDTPEELQQTGIPCFAAGTQIVTRFGARPVEKLREGDQIKLYDGELAPVLRVYKRLVPSLMLKLFPNLRPVRISKGALGCGLPKRDLLVSQQHRMLVRSAISQRMFGSEVLIAAHKLVGLPGVFVDPSDRDIEYVHLLLDKHSVIFAEGTPTESLYTGPEALKAIAPEAKAEIITLFPELESTVLLPRTAFPVPKGRAQKRLIHRHAKNAKAILQ